MIATITSFDHRSNFVCSASCHVGVCMEHWCPAPFELRGVSSNQRCASGCVVDRRICNREVAGFESRPGLLRTFHPSGIGK